MGSSVWSSLSRNAQDDIMLHLQLQQLHLSWPLEKVSTQSGEYKVFIALIFYGN